jgi:hypothetical protein
VLLAHRLVTSEAAARQQHGPRSDLDRRIVGPSQHRADGAVVNENDVG